MDRNVKMTVFPNGEQRAAERLLESYEEQTADVARFFTHLKNALGVLEWAVMHSRACCLVSEFGHSNETAEQLEELARRIALRQLQCAETAVEVAKDTVASVAQHLEPSYACPGHFCELEQCV